MNIGFIGMTHLGIVSSISAAEKNFNVICYDNDRLKIDKLKRSIFEIDEPKLSYYYKKNIKKIQFTKDLKDLNSTSLVYLSLDIKTNNTGVSDYKEINQMIKSICSLLNKKCILIILCQIAPGFTRKIQWPKNKLFYQVETLIFGRAFERSLMPERIIVGQEAIKNLPTVYSKFLNKFKCPIIKMNYESAELAKISINLFLISQVTTTNAIVEISKKIGANWNSIKLALNLDKRIGKQAYLNPGLGISGGNLERDLSTIQSLASNQRTSTVLFEAFENLSSYYKNWCYRKFNEIKKNNNLDVVKVGVLGLTYKTETNSIKNSPSILLIKKLLKRNIQVMVNDPILNKNDISLPVKFMNDPIKIIYQSNIIFIMLRSKKYLKIKLNKNKINKKKYLIDPFSVIQCEKIDLIKSVSIK